MICKYTYICTYTVLSLGSEPKRLHAAFVFLNLAYFDQHNDFKLHPFFYKCYDFVFLLDSQNFIVYMHHVFFILSRDGGTGCFCFLASVKSEEINTGVQARCVGFESLVYVPRSGRAGLHEI